MLELPMHGSFVSLLGGRMLTDNAPAWIWHPPPTPPVCHGISVWNRTHVHTSRSRLPFAQSSAPSPSINTAMSVRSQGHLLWLFFSSASFFSPKATQPNNHSSCHPLHPPFSLLTFNFLLEICFTYLQPVWNFNELKKNLIPDVFR